MTDKSLQTPIRHSITLPNDINTVPQLNDFIDGFSLEAGLDMSMTMSLNLALEEAVVNVMTYAYAPDTQGELTLEAVADKGVVTFILTDTGVPFDPTAKEDADTTLGVEDRPIGGLGIFMVRQLMDTVDYQRVDGQNILTLTKKLTAKQ
jgi:sigma-B regulation protein RsbU (phosphoserine phosphatase)